jgi:hypothetical protein
LIDQKISSKLFLYIKKELISKLEKSQLEYNKWCERKEEYIQKQKGEMNFKELLN